MAEDKCQMADDKCQRREKGTSPNSTWLTPKPLASSVYMHAPEASSPLKRSILVMSVFPPRSERCRDQLARPLDRETGAPTGERQGFLLTFRAMVWYTETLSGSATCPTCATGSRVLGRAAAKLVRRHGTRRSLSPYRRTRPARPGRTT